jgi:hypothetical protein
MNKTETFPVVIVDYKAIVNKATGEEFHQLLLEQDGMVQRKDGTFRAGEKKCRITSTWSKAKCDAYKGRNLPGNWQIVKVECPEYEYEVNGVMEKFSHTWVLLPA